VTVSPDKLPPAEKPGSAGKLLPGSAGKLLIVEDNPGLRRQLSWSFPEYDVSAAGDRGGALSLLKSERPTVVLLDLGLPPDAQGTSEGLATLEAIRQEAPATKVVVMTGCEDRAAALRAIALGAYDYCNKPMDIELLRLILQRARHVQALEEEARAAAQAGISQPLNGFITCAASALQACRIVERVAPADVTVLLLGESGTGKEVLARALHDLSPRAHKPFIAINCGAIPENLLESELFGHEKGSFTGAIKQTIGKVEQANGGTLFLDEIGDIPLPLQVKLLRFLQERRIERIGGRQAIPVDVRIVCATHKDLRQGIADGAFREDLYYRLNEVAVTLPPLRDRPGDPGILAHYFLNRFAAQYRRPVKGFTSDATAALAAHSWPGNVRELQNRVKRAVLMAEGDLIAATELDLASRDEGAEPPQPSLREVRHAAERQALVEALIRAEGNISQAAKMLDVSRPTLYALIKLHAVNLPTLKEG